MYSHTGIVTFKDAKTFAAAKGAFGDRPHLEPMVASYGDNEDYVYKRGKFVDKAGTRVPGAEIEVFGTPWSQGKRNDVSAYVQAVWAGDSNYQLLLEHPAAHLRFGRSASAIRIAKRQRERGELAEPRERRPPRVIVLYGDAGTGKTYDAWGLLGRRADCFVYVQTDGGRSWFDGYEGQRNVLIDDFEGGIHITILKNILDRYGCVVEVKGGTVEWNPELIIITANGHPRTWYTWSDKSPYAALERRIEKMLHYEMLESGTTKKTVMKDRATQVEIQVQRLIDLTQDA